MRCLVLLLLLLTNYGDASKTSKSGVLPGSVRSCPNFSGGSGKSAVSKKQSKAGSGSCEIGEIDTIRCGDSLHNQKVFLLKDLVCDNEDDTISLHGEHSVLDCGGRTIVGKDSAASDDVILELHDGASVINCNFANGYNAISTHGDGCSTIENVSVYAIDDHGIQVGHSGTVVIKDVSVYKAFEDGIKFVIEDGDVLHAVLDDVRVFNSMIYGITFFCFRNDCGGDIVADFYGNTFLWDNRNDNLYIAGDVNVDMTVFGNIFSGGSRNGNGLDVENDSSITFSPGSFSEICDNTGTGDIDYTNDGRVFVEDGAEIICDVAIPGNNICSDECAVDEARACIE